jgi:hypothetical protein
MKEAAELLEELQQMETFTGNDLPSRVTEKMLALRLALECDPENAIILRWQGTERVFDLHEPPSRDLLFFLEGLRGKQ